MNIYIGKKVPFQYHQPSGKSHGLMRNQVFQRQSLRSREDKMCVGFFLRNCMERAGNSELKRAINEKRSWSREE